MVSSRPFYLPLIKYKKNDCNIKYPFEFNPVINNYQLLYYLVVSFDVVSLFTNLPLEVVLINIEKHWEEISSHTTLNLNHTVNILKFIFNSVNYALDDLIS